MFYFITESQLISFLSSYDINYYLFSPFEQAICLLLGNILYLIYIIIFISAMYKIVCRIIRWFR